MSSLSKSYKEAFKNPELRRFAQGFFSLPSLTATAATIAAGRLVEVTSNTVRKASEQSAAVIGITRGGVSASDADVEVEWGRVPVYLASPVSQLDELSARAEGMAAKKMASQVTLLAATAGGNFANQPAGDGVTVVSAAAGDTTQTVTIYGTITGATTSVTSETLTLNGKTDVDSSITTWQNILAVELSAATAGNIEVSETSGGAAITTITAGTTSAGIATISTTNAYGLIPRHDASGASTAPIALIGTGVDGSALSVVDTLNGTTEEDHATTAYATVTKAYIGAVASSVNVVLLTNDSTDSTTIGVALEASSAAGVTKDCWIKPYFF